VVGELITRAQVLAEEIVTTSKGDNDDERITMKFVFIRFRW
jgi:hypothetical protein